MYVANRIRSLFWQVPSRSHRKGLIEINASSRKKKKNQRLVISWLVVAIVPLCFWTSLSSPIKCNIRPKAKSQGPKELGKKFRCEFYFLFLNTNKKKTKISYKGCQLPNMSISHM
jgi:hypothetical protein